VSIISSIHADIGNRKREEWIKMLEEAYATRDWNLLRSVIDYMREDVFCE